MIQIRAMRHDRDSLATYVRLFEKAFPDNARFTVAYLDWLYNANPDGLAIGFDAWDGGELVAHYVCIPSRVEIHGAASRAMLSLNTATHPSHQGQGLFTRLATATYDAAASIGIEAVYGVANANSTPGFVRKLGFKLIKPLDAQIGWGTLDPDWDTVREQTSFRRQWNSANLFWRMSNPKNHVFAHRGRDCTQFFAKAKGWALPVYAECECDFPIEPSLVRRPIWLAPRLFLGLFPTGSRRHSTYVQIPQSLRPSPLNFIYRALSCADPSLDEHGLNLSFLDFDAY